MKASFLSYFSDFEKYSFLIFIPNIVEAMIKNKMLVLLTKVEYTAIKKIDAKNIVDLFMKLG
jgi:hypothetical protein